MDIKHYFLKKDYFYLILFNFLISKKKVMNGITKGLFHFFLRFF